MEISIFDVLGPVMIGPSSSHTAGAAKLARVAAQIAGKPFYKVNFILHGSFAKTGTGHGTDKALLAGTMGIAEDDIRLSNSFQIAKEKNIQFAFEHEELSTSHENTVKIEFFHEDSKSVIQGASLGGGRILITEIDGIPTEFCADNPTLLITQRDCPGVLHTISKSLGVCGVNIATMRVARTSKGDIAYTVVEMDEPAPLKAIDRIKNAENILQVRVIGTGGQND